jgi:hypothetical protein
VRDFVRWKAGERWVGYSIIGEKGLVEEAPDEEDIENGAEDGGEGGGEEELVLGCGSEISDSCCSVVGEERRCCCCRRCVLVARRIAHTSRFSCFRS